MGLIKNYEVTLFEPPCMPGSPRWSSVVTIDADLTDLLPYLNGYLKKRFYDPNTPSIVFKMNGHGKSASATSSTGRKERRLPKRSSNS